LVDVATGAQIWGNRYTRGDKDASLLQAAITSDLASQLRPQLGGEERESIAKVGTRDGEAYKSYLKGRFYSEDWMPENLRAAADFFSKAIARDPNYAAAHAGLADVYMAQVYIGDVSGPVSVPQQMERARSAAHRALELDSQIPESHVALAKLNLYYYWNFAEAEEEARRAVAIDPNSTYALHASCAIKMTLRRTQEGLADCRRAVEVDPLSAFTHIYLGGALNLVRQYGQAIEEANKALDIEPKSSEAVGTLGVAYQMTGNYQRAIEQWVKIAQAQSGEEHARDLMRVFEKSGYSAYLLQDARDAQARDDQYELAGDYAMLGQKDAAFAALEKMFARRAARIVDINVDPTFDNLRSDARFADLLRRIGLPQ
jgi:Tfp pilus assembly protein PilF